MADGCFPSEDGEEYRRDPRPVGHRPGASRGERADLAEVPHWSGFGNLAVPKPLQRGTPTIGVTGFYPPPRPPGYDAVRSASFDGIR